MHVLRRAIFSTKRPLPSLSPPGLGIGLGCLRVKLSVAFILNVYAAPPMFWHISCICVLGLFLVILDSEVYSVYGYKQVKSSLDSEEVYLVWFYQQVKALCSTHSS